MEFSCNSLNPEELLEIPPPSCAAVAVTAQGGEKSPFSPVWNALELPHGSPEGQAMTST